MIPTTDRLRQFAHAVQNYLNIKGDYRAVGSRNPQRKQELRTIRNAAFKNAQILNADLHTHLSKFPEPDYTALQARELIRLWDARNICYENLIHLSRDDNPGEAIRRLDNAERKLKKQLQTVQELLKTITTN